MGLDEEDFFVIARRLSEYLKNVTLLGAQTQKWDVILTYQPILDELGHRFYMTNATQKDYSVATKKYYMGLIKRGYLQASKVIEDFTNALPKSNLVVVSDHGMSPLHTIYYPNRALMRLGFIEDAINENSGTNKRYEARAFSSGGLSHIYINLKGRGPDGIVTPTNFKKIQNRLVKYFRLKNKDNPIASVYKRADLKQIGLDHPNSGDIVLVAKPGYHLTDMMGHGELTEPASFYGQHGYDPGLPEMKGIFGAFGPDIEAKSLSRINYKKVLPFILKLLKN